MDINVMIQKIFTIYDEKAHAYLTPFFLPHADMATRTFGGCINSPDHQFGRHPQDYSLFEIGLYTDTDGVIQPHDRSKSLGNGLEFVKRDPQPDLFEETHETKIGDDAPILPGAGSGNTPL